MLLAIAFTISKSTSPANPCGRYLLDSSPMAVPEVSELSMYNLLHFILFPKPALQMAFPALAG